MCFFVGIPVVQIAQNSYSVNFGGTVTLVCTVTANPTHTSVQWLRVINGQSQNLNLVQNKHSGSTVNTPSITINSADLSDEGNYICTATNSIGTGQSQQTFLDVVGSMCSYLPIMSNTQGFRHSTKYDILLILQYQSILGC